MLGMGHPAWRDLILGAAPPTGAQLCLLPASLPTTLLGAPSPDPKLQALPRKGS